jgi:putative transposase
VKYVGKRRKRGMFVTSTGIRLNADVNGAGNIMRKVVPNKQVYFEGIEAVVGRPVRKSIPYKGSRES